MSPEQAGRLRNWLAERMEIDYMPNVYNDPDDRWGVRVAWPDGSALVILAGVVVAPGGSYVDGEEVGVHGGS